MRTAAYQKAAERRIARAEAEANAAITRAFTNILQVLQHEKTEWLIFRDRKRKGVRR